MKNKLESIIKHLFIFSIPVSVINTVDIDVSVPI